MESGLYFEEYTAGWTYQTGPAAITEDSIRDFMALHGLDTPSGTDPQSMPSPYGGRLAPAVMVLSMAEALVLDAGVTRQRGILLLQLDSKYKKAVYAGDQIVNHIRLKSKRPSSQSDRGIVVTEHSVVTQNGDVAILYEAVRMIRTREFVEDRAQRD